MCRLMWITSSPAGSALPCFDSLRLTAEPPGVSARRLSPPPLPRPTLMRRLPATGRRIQHPTWRAAGAWTARARVLEPAKSRRPGTTADEAAPAMAGNRRPPNGCMAGSKSFGNGAERLAEEWTGTEIAVTRVPKGNPLGRETAPGGLTGPPWVAESAPAFPSHPRRRCRRGWWRWPRGLRR